MTDPLFTAAGPFLKPRPSPATTIVKWQYCYYWMDVLGQIVAIEWIEQ